MTTQALLEPATIEITETKATYEDYLALSHEGWLIEWVNEEVIYHMPPKPRHQILAGYLDRLLGNFIHFFNLGEVLPAPTEMKCFPRGNSREPDILFLAKENLARIGESRIEGPADLIIEIVSNDSVTRDFNEKFVEYQECGVLEYWIIDPRPHRKRALFYQLGKNGRYESILPKNGVYRSKIIPGFWLEVSWLWEMPDPLLTFAEIAGLPAEILAILKAKKSKN
ncbi:MAG: Uma2 family endonuclease [Anaerolineales bacterium]